jgi:hypothetical protein
MIIIVYNEYYDGKLRSRAAKHCSLYLPENTVETCIHMTEFERIKTFNFSISDTFASILLTLKLIVSVVLLGCDVMWTHR